MDAASILITALKASIALTVVALGMRASWHDALYLFRNPWMLVRSVLSMNVVMPLVAAALVLAFDLPTPVKVALVALAVSPVPPILPMKELKAGGHASYAVGLLVAIAVLAIITVPVAVSVFTGLFERAGEIAPMGVAKIVLASVLAPLAVGIALRQFAPGLAQRFGRPVALLGMALLIASTLPLAYGAWPAMRALIGNGTVLILAAMAAIGLLVGHLLGGPRDDDRTVLALSTASRHPAVALAVAVAAGGEKKPELAAILLYLLVALVVTVPYVTMRKRAASAINETA